MNDYPCIDHVEKYVDAVRRFNFEQKEVNISNAIRNCCQGYPKTNDSLAGLFAHRGLNRAAFERLLMFDIDRAFEASLQPSPAPAPVKRTFFNRIINFFTA